MRSVTTDLYREGTGLRVESVPVPRIEANEMMIRVRNASICATDIRIVTGQHRKYGPGVVRIPGHEMTGVVEEIGAQVRGFTPGELVFIAPNIGRGRCLCCRRGKNNLCPNYDAFGITLDGGFAEFMRVTAPAIEQGNVMALPENFDPATAALAEPFACVVHGADAANIGAGDTVLILGAGSIGLMHLLLARARGASRILVADVAPDRLEIARTLRADEAIDPGSPKLADAVSRATAAGGADVVIVAAPSAEAQRDALTVAGPGGRINFFAGLPKDKPFVSIEANLVHYKELVVTGTTGCSTEDCRRALHLVVSDAVNLAPLISARFPVKQAADAFAAARDRKNLKIVLEMDPPARLIGGTIAATQTL
jgi:L-iditol 2-dehydrogenase